MIELPEHLAPGEGTHAAHHAALKTDYDQRHPDDPLPDYQPGEVHRKIHRLLAEDLNTLAQGPLPIHLPEGAGGHLRDHTLLHTAYNQRHHG